MRPDGVARDREADAGGGAAELGVGGGERRDADDGAGGVDQRAAAVAGLIGALVWITAGSATPPPSGTVRLVELTMPWVTLERRPSGLPIARA